MDLLNLFMNTKEVENYAAGQVIYNEGDEGHALYIVLAGEVHVIVRGELLYVVEAGDIIGEMALIDSLPRSATTIAKTDCKLAVVDEKHFLFMVQQTPFFSLQVMRTLVERLRRMDQKWLDRS